MMQKNKILLFFLFLAILTTSCSKRWCSSHYPPIASKDSIYVETIKEIPVLIPGDTIRVNTPVINCPDQDIVSMENSKLKQQIKILNGKLISSTLIKPDTIKVFVPKIEIRVKEIKVLEPIKFVPKIVSLFAWIGGSCVLLILGYIALKIFKK